MPLDNSDNALLMSHCNQLDTGLKDSAKDLTPVFYSPGLDEGRAMPSADSIVVEAASKNNDADVNVATTSDTPLGRWLQASPIHQKWRDYVDLDDESAPHLIRMDWSPHDSGEVMFAYPESNHAQFRKTGAIVVLNQPQQMHPTTVLHEMLVYLISGYSQITLEAKSTNEVVKDGIHPLLRTIQAMPAAYRDIIGVCQQLPPIAALQSPAAELLDGTVTVATDGSVRSDDGTYSWIIDGSISGIRLAGHAKAAQTRQDPMSM
jgi:hypothetical protein